EEDPGPVAGRAAVVELPAEPEGDVDQAALRHPLARGQEADAAGRVLAGGPTLDHQAAASRRAQNASNSASLPSMTVSKSFEPPSASTVFKPCPVMRSTTGRPSAKAPPAARRFAAATTVPPAVSPNRPSVS